MAAPTATGHPDITGNPQARPGWENSRQLNTRSHQYSALWRRALELCDCDR
jgi:hypothetical protein